MEDGENAFFNFILYLNIEIQIKSNQIIGTSDLIPHLFRGLLNQPNSKQSDVREVECNHPFGTQYQIVHNYLITYLPLPLS